MTHKSYFSHISNSNSNCDPFAGYVRRYNRSELQVWEIEKKGTQAWKCFRTVKTKHAHVTISHNIKTNTGGASKNTAIH